jgi:hypothetical protein
MSAEDQAKRLSYFVPAGFLLIKQSEMDRIHNESEALRIERDEAQKCGFAPACRVALFDSYVALPEAQERFERAERECDEAKRALSEFRDGLTAALNAAGVPASPSWAEAINHLVRERDHAQKLYLSTGEALDRVDDSRIKYRQALVQLLLFGERLMQSDSMEERAIGCSICEGARIVAPSKGMERGA